MYLLTHCSSFLGMGCGSTTTVKTTGCATLPLLGHGGSARDLVVDVVRGVSSRCTEGGLTPEALCGSISGC